MNFNKIRLIQLFTLSILTSSCAITTRTFEGTSETFVNTGEASVDFSSSTFPRKSSDSTSSSKSKDAARREMVVRYASYNYDKIRKEASQGHGEFVSTLGELLLTPQENIELFPQFVNSNYCNIFPIEQPQNADTRGEQLLTRLEIALKNNS
jgi:hypothetical protein